MANDNKKKSNGDRYSAVDSIPWHIVDTAGKKIGSDSYTGFRDAEGAANTYRISTGLHAAAVRS
jgi:hypothetical protein